MNKYRKIPINQIKNLDLYPVYTNKVYDGHEPLKIIGIRKNQVELEGDFSGGTHNVTQSQWFDDKDVFALYSVCNEQLKTYGCQLPNVHCCGGGELIKKHIHYWNDVIN